MKKILIFMAIMLIAFGMVGAKKDKGDHNNDGHPDNGQQCHGNNPFCDDEDDGDDTGGGGEDGDDGTNDNNDQEDGQDDDTPGEAPDGDAETGDGNNNEGSEDTSNEDNQDTQGNGQQETQENIDGNTPRQESTGNGFFTLEPIHATFPNKDVYYFYMNGNDAYGFSCLDYNSLTQTEHNLVVTKVCPNNWQVRSFSADFADKVSFGWIALTLKDGESSYKAYARYDGFMPEIENMDWVIG